jgi:hypothetical protein
LPSSSIGEVERRNDLARRIQLDLEILVGGVEGRQVQRQRALHQHALGAELEVVDVFAFHRRQRFTLAQGCGGVEGARLVAA